MTPAEYRAIGDSAYVKVMQLRQDANRLLNLASQWEQEAILAWAKAEPPTPESSPPLDTTRPPC